MSLWLNLNQMNEIKFLQPADKQGKTLRFTFIHRAQNTNIHTSNDIGCPKIVPPSPPLPPTSFYWFSHLA